MKLQKIDGNVLTLMLALAFFNFIFLGTEYQFDNMAALVTGPEQVVTAQGYVGCFRIILPSGPFGSMPFTASSITFSGFLFIISRRVVSFIPPT